MKEMKIHIIISVALLLAGYAAAEDKTLPDKLVDVTVAHIKGHGPDEDTAQFIATERVASWERREEIAGATIPYLKSKESAKVAGALAVLYRLRAYGPMQDLIGAGGSAWEQKYKPGPFWAKLDQHVMASCEHVHSLGDPKAFHNLALYLGVSTSPESGRELLKIASETPEKEQALICLAWHRDPKDMDSLLPFMLKEAGAAWNLPYHFRNSYGQAAFPYLKRSLEEAQSPLIRLRTAYELVHMHVPEGFHYLQQVALANPEPEDRTWSRPLEDIRQFAIDYLNLPRDSVAPAAIAAHIAKKEQELCKLQSIVEAVSNQVPEDSPTVSVDWSFAQGSNHPAVAITIKNVSVEELKVQHPGNREAIAFVVMDDHGNVMKPEGVAKVDPSRLDIVLKPGGTFEYTDNHRTELAHEQGLTLPFLTGTALFAYNLKEGNNYRVTVIYRPYADREGVASAEQVMTFK
jgi:hypothetical protein